MRRSLLLLPYLICTLGAQSSASGTLVLTLTDPSGRPLAGVRVVITGGALTGERSMVSDAHGLVRFTLLPVGRMRVVASLPEHIATALMVNVEGSESLSRTLVLRPIASASAVVEVVATTSPVDRTTVQRPRKSVHRMNVRGGGAPAASFMLAPGIAHSIRTPSALPNTEAYAASSENPFKAARRDPLSTFGIDVDTAAYSNVRRFLNQGQLPPRAAVRLEELINHFPYPYPDPVGDRPFGVHTEVLTCPWAPAHRLLRVALQARRLRLDQLPPRNLVFLIDVSGSMGNENKLPLAQRGLARLCDSLRPEDRVAIVVYAGNSGLVLDSTPGSDQGRIREALERLSAGGSTHGAAGIEQAYQVARKAFITGGDNRVLLCTDGDFNVGVSDLGSLVRLIEGQRKSGVFLTCLGFGMGNLKDATLEQLADKGNGHYAYIDNLREMEKVFGIGGGGLVTVARDVKVQVEFNPARVQAYRLLGYENRLMEAEDFNDDAKDGGEMNAGHGVTALYELVPPGAPMDLPGVDPLKYQRPAQPSVDATDDLVTVKVRYKKPDGLFSRKLEWTVADRVLSLPQASPESRWATAVAAFGLVLRDSPHKGTATLDLAEQLAKGTPWKDDQGLRQEFLELLTQARDLSRSTPRSRP